MTSDLACHLRAIAPTSVVTADADIGGLTTYRVGGNASALVDVGSNADLGAIAQVACESGLGVFTIGLGSNLLIPDSGFDGIVLRLGSAFESLTFDATTVTAGAACSLPTVARRTVSASLAGFEWAVGVPGSIGGAVRMNAGGHGSDMAASVTRVHGVDLATGDRFSKTNADLDFGYRHSSIATHECVTSVELTLPGGDSQQSSAELSEIVRWRRANQPGGQNAGSVFTNPPDTSAGLLIDEAGCKGLRIGSAEVSTKHANFIQADPQGSADDVLRVMDEVTARVQRSTGTTLIAETRIVGRNLLPRQLTTRHSAATNHTTGSTA